MSQPKNAQQPSGPVTSGDLTITVDRDMCIGAATCIAIAPHTFLLDSEAKTIVLDSTEADSEEMIIDAARGCPVAAVIITRNGSQVYPE